MSITIAPPPQETDLVEPFRDISGDTRYPITAVWYQWLVKALITRVQTSSVSYAPETLTGQGASIATTPLPLASVVGGLYRISWYARVTTAAGVSSSLTVTISWTESTVSLSSSGAAMTGNTTTTTQSGSILIRSDGSSPISYSTTYASNAAGAMKYRLDIVPELVAS